MGDATTVGRLEMPAVFRAAVRRVPVLTLLWWIFTEGEPYSVGLGAVVVLAAVATSLFTLPPGAGRISFLGLARFVPYFLRASLSGGWDVTRRAFAKGAVEPVFFEISLRLRDARARAFLAGVICLVPGTLSARLLTDGRLLVHALDRRMPARASVKEAERRVADLFGIDQPSA